MGGLSPIHWLIIAMVVLLLFGNRLPSVMRSLGLGVVEFKKGLQGIQDEMSNQGAAKDKIEKDKVETEQQHQATNEPAAKQ
jgi:sec-independent protein translocase protein TatA